MAKAKNMSSLFVLFRYLLPYKSRLIAASCALIFTAVITLAIGQGVRILIDEGFVGGSQDQLNKAIGFIVALAFLMSIGTFIRFYLVSWLGERVSADIRLDVFNHIITLHPSYFETNRSGEIMSRLTTDTTLLQSIIGSSVSMALRSSLTMTGALVMLLVTNFKAKFSTWIKRKLEKDTEDVLFTEGWGGMCVSDDWVQSMEQTLITLCAASLLWTVHRLLYTD